MGLKGAIHPNSTNFRRIARLDVVARVRRLCEAGLLEQRPQWLEWCERVPPMENHNLHLQARNIRNPYPQMIRFLLRKYPDLRFQDCYVDGNDWSAGNDSFRADHPVMQFVARQLEIMRTEGVSKREAFQRTEELFRQRREHLEREQKVMMAMALDAGLAPMFATGQAYLQAEKVKSEAAHLNEIRRQLRDMRKKAADTSGFVVGDAVRCRVKDPRDEGAGDSKRAIVQAVDADTNTVTVAFTEDGSTRQVPADSDDIRPDRGAQERQKRTMERQRLEELDEMRSKLVETTLFKTKLAEERPDEEAAAEGAEEPPPSKILSEEEAAQDLVGKRGEVDELDSSEPTVSPGYEQQLRADDVDRRAGADAAAAAADTAAAKREEAEKSSRDLRAPDLDIHITRGRRATQPEGSRKSAKELGQMTGFGEVMGEDQQDDSVDADAQRLASKRRSSAGADDGEGRSERKTRDMERRKARKGGEDDGGRGDR